MKLKQLGTALVCTMALYAGNGLAAEYDLTNNLLASLDLPVNELQIYNASWFRDTQLKCTVRTVAGGKGYDVTAIAMKHRLLINGNIIPEATTTSLFLHSGDVVYFELAARGKMGLTNNGDDLISLLCN